MLLTSLTALVNFVLAGEVPDRIKPVLAGANLSAFNKPDDGLRPITVGETIRRLAAKCASRVALGRFEGTLVPIQIGCGTK